MITRLLLFLALTVFSLNLHAEKLYRILDENGNVSFSQYPPMAKEENVTVEGITVDTSSESIVTEGVDGRYCGDIKLPDQSSSGYATASYTKKLEKIRSSWLEQLDTLNQRVDQSNQNAIESNKRAASSNSRYNQGFQSKHSKQYQKSIAANTERLRDLHCALSWADREHQGTTEFIASQKNERERLVKIRDDLQEKLNASCGETPPYDPSAGRNDAVRKRWYDCSDKLRREIDLVQGEIAKL